MGDIASNPAQVERDLHAGSEVRCSPPSAVSAADIALSAAELRQQHTGGGSLADSVRSDRLADAVERALADLGELTRTRTRTRTRT